MRTVFIILFLAVLLACSNNSDVIEGNEVRDADSDRTTDNHAETNQINSNRNIIRERTEADFRSLKPQNRKSYNPITPLTSGNSPSDKDSSKSGEK